MLLFTASLLHKQTKSCQFVVFVQKYNNQAIVVVQSFYANQELLKTFSPVHCHLFSIFRTFFVRCYSFDKHYLIYTETWQKNRKQQTTRSVFNFLRTIFSILYLKCTWDRFLSFRC